MNRRLLAVLIAFSPLAAGCLSAVGETLDPSDVIAPEDVLAAGLFVHKGDGTVLPSSSGTLQGDLLSTGFATFEPTLGIDSDGTIFYVGADGANGVLIGFEARVWRSDDNGLTWTDVSPELPTGHPIPPETNDPFLYVDPATDRVFQFSMAPILACSMLSWSDDKGASWDTNFKGCAMPPPWDHQSMVAAAPREDQPTGYPNILHQCTNNGAQSWCARSLDGGATWLPGAYAFPMPGCSGLHGHPAASPDGIVYLPKDDCGETWVAISEDDGKTWEQVLVDAGPGEASSDPAIAVDDAGNVYMVFVGDDGALWLSVSTDQGQSWSDRIRASPPGVTTHIPTIAAGAAGKIAIAYPGTEDLPQGYDSPRSVQNQARWNAYMAVVDNALDPNPTFQTLRLNDPSDPIVRGQCGPGRCPALVDFMDVVIGPNGRAYAAFVDGCTGACATNGEDGGDNNADDAILGRITAGPLLR